MLTGREIVQKLTGIQSMDSMSTKPIAEITRGGITSRVVALDYKAAWGDKWLVQSVDGLGEPVWVTNSVLRWIEND